MIFMMTDPLKVVVSILAALVAMLDNYSAKHLLEPAPHPQVSHPDGLVHDAHALVIEGQANVGRIQIPPVSPGGSRGPLWT